MQAPITMQLVIANLRTVGKISSSNTFVALSRPPHTPVSSPSAWSKRNLIWPDFHTYSISGLTA